MKGLTIDFTGDEPVLDLGRVVEGNNATTQNVVVNMGTSKGAPVFPDRGTNLLAVMLGSGFVSKQFAQHAANFAAVDSRYFIKTFSTEPDGLTDIILTAPDRPSSGTAFRLQTKFGTDTIEEDITL